MAPRRKASLRNRPVVVLLFSVMAAACAPEVGSSAWCEAMDDKDKGEWSGNELREYAKHCVFRKPKD